MQMKTSVTKPQLIAVTIITLILLAGGVGISGIFGDFSMRSVSAQGTFSTSVDGLPEATTSEMVNLKNGDTYNLTASIVKKNINGKEIKMLAYNGSIPGPTIKVPQGSEVTINFTNNTDVATTLHSHGVRLDNQFDGIPDVTQKAIPIGGSFSYKIKFPDAGIFWYHPHIREDYAQGLGLYGNYLVTSYDANYLSPVNKEVPLMLSDILLDSNGKTDFSKKEADHALMGRFGNVMLVNGETNYQLSANTGDVVRLYLTDVANTRTFNFSIPNAKMKLVAGDGGKYEKETFIDSVILAPSEREVVDVYFPQSGTYTLTHTTPDTTYTLGTIDVSSTKTNQSYVGQFNILRTNTDVIKDIDAFRTYFDKKADKRLKLTVDLNGMSMGSSGNSMSGHNMEGGQMMMSDGSMMAMGKNDPIEWEDTMSMMNVGATPETVKWKLVDEDTNKENGDINWTFKKGDKVKIEIYNDPNSPHPMQHPIHFHGQRFLVLSTNGVKNTNLVWKDTVLVKNGDRVDILLDASNIGTWMAHCHIAEHLESGMMLSFKVQ
jgi:suppressor of ftsI